MIDQAAGQKLILDHIRDVPDWPKPGVVFKDITPLLQDAEAFRTTVDMLIEAAPGPIDVVVGMEARGFIFAAPVALGLNAGFVPVRKPGKLPGEVIGQQFALESGQATLEIKNDALWKDARVLVVDDILATGGTVAATAELIKRRGAKLVHCAVMMELGFLNGRDALKKVGVDSVSALVTV